MDDFFQSLFVSNDLLSVLYNVMMTFPMILDIHEAEQDMVFVLRFPASIFLL